MRRATSAPWKIGVGPQRIAPPAPRRSRRCGKRGKRARVGHERGGHGPAGAVGTRTLFPLFPQPDPLQPGRDLDGKEWRLTATVQPSPAGAPSDQIPTPESAAAHQHVRDDGSQRVTHVSGPLCYPCLVRTLPTKDDGANRAAIRTINPWGKRPARTQTDGFAARDLLGLVRGAFTTGCQQSVDNVAGGPRAARRPADKAREGGIPRVFRPKRNDERREAARSRRDASPVEHPATLFTGC